MSSSFYFMFSTKRLRFSKTVLTEQACVTVRYILCIFSLQDRELGTITLCPGLEL